MELKVFKIWDLKYGICQHGKLKIVLPSLLSKIKLQNQSVKNASFVDIYFSSKLGLIVHKHICISLEYPKLSLTTSFNTAKTSCN